MRVAVPIVGVSVLSETGQSDTYGKFAERL